MNAITGSINSTTLFLQLRATDDTRRPTTSDNPLKEVPEEQHQLKQDTVSVRYQAIPPSLLARLHFKSELENNSNLDIRI